MPQMQFVEPNSWDLSGSGVHVRYTNVALPGPAGGPHLTYQHTHGVAKQFSGNEIRSLLVPDLGMVVSVTLQMTVDAGSTTFSLLLPNTSILLQGPISSVPVHTDAITTHHAGPLAPILAHGQKAFYSVVSLSGTASHVMAE